MVPIAIKANPSVSEDAGKVAFIRGPLTYCAEWADNGIAPYDENAGEFNGSELARLIVDSDSVRQGIREYIVSICGMNLKGLEIDGYRENIGDPDSVIPCIYREFDPMAESRSLSENRTVIRLIPYFAWANRGEGEMRVWLRVR